MNKFPQLSFEEVCKILDLKEVNLSETRFYQDVRQKGREQGVQRQDLVRSLTIAQLEALGDALLDFNKNGRFRGLVYSKFIT